MTELFYSLEQDFNKSINQINRKISGIPNQSNEMKEAAIQDAQSELRDAENCIKQMELEANPLPEQSRRELYQKIRQYRIEYEDVKKKFMRCEESYLDQKSKEKLMGERFENDDFKYSDGKGLIYQQNNKLKDAKKTGFMTLEIASNTNTALQGQTQTLMNGHDRLRRIDGDLGESLPLIQSMQRQIMKNRLTLYSVIGVVGLAVILIIVSYF